ncbi:MAG: ATP-binding cassette domain-containing protein [Candidatus Bipolaricaulota bacterium]|nr:ATP-binding cassette domain-containing protein [Candidatus Bipolaricaulota bacterium]MBS3792501.1 ATP-binding cassette domain-containing protein [Candidatus Bipolaricaulota bacterium]
MLKVNNLTKKFFPGTPNELTAVDDLDLEMTDGDFLTVIGSNGAGKTTFLNLIAGTMTPTRGRIFLDGQEVTQVPEYECAELVGRVFQEPGRGTASGMTVAQNLVLALNKGHKSLRIGVNRERREFFKEELGKLGLGLENRLDEKVVHLSGGQRQALAVLMATLTMPKILLLDEHTASLDPKNAKKILEVTKKLVSEKELTTIMVTHDMNQAIDLGNRLIMLHRGSMICDVEDGQKEELTVDKLIELFSEKDIVDDELLLTTRQ